MNCRILHQWATELRGTLGVERAGIWQVAMSLGISLTRHVMGMGRRDTNQQIILDYSCRCPEASPVPSLE